MEIIVSHFKLDGWEKGEWECVRRGKGKTFLSRLMFRREKLFPALQQKLNSRRISASFTLCRDDCNQVACLKTCTRPDRPYCTGTGNLSVSCCKLKNMQPLPLRWPPDNHIPHWELELKECRTQQKKNKSPVAQDKDQRSLLLGQYWKLHVAVRIDADF